MPSRVQRLELGDFPKELVDTARHRRVPLKHLVFDLVDVVLESGDDRLVLVDDLVEDRVQHRLGSEAEKVG